MVHHPGVYAELLRDHISKSKADCWLLNTGWSGGSYGEGQRMKISFTRAMVRAALNGSLAQVETRPHPIFGVHVPVSCPEVPSEVLQPRNTWKNPAAYDEKAHHLARLFQENFKQFSTGVSEKVKASGPVAS
jgi:phosphoenolpyruvate carboxykinase (ATP)